jgi:hypothetical protein
MIPWIARVSPARRDEGTGLDEWHGSLICFAMLVVMQVMYHGAHFALRQLPQSLRTIDELPAACPACRFGRLSRDSRQFAWREPGQNRLSGGRFFKNH